MARASRAPSTTALVTSSSALISRIRSIWLRSRFISRKLPPVMRIIAATVSGPNGWRGRCLGEIRDVIAQVCKTAGSPEARRRAVCAWVMGRPTLYRPVAPHGSRFQSAGPAQCALRSVRQVNLAHAANTALEKHPTSARRAMDQDLLVGRRPTLAGSGRLTGGCGQDCPPSREDALTRYAPSSPPDTPRIWGRLVM